MNQLTAKRTGWLAMLVGMSGILSFITLLLFFVSLFQNIDSLAFMGALNDTLNAVTSILSAFLASVLYPALHKFHPRVSLILLIGVWVGAIAVAFGSWLIQTGRADVELSSYYFFFGSGLIGIWLGILNRIVRRLTVWPRPLHRLGYVASSFMMLGLLGLYGILLGLDGNDYSPLILVTGLSYLGIGIFYPIWCLWLAHWILLRQDDGST